MSKARNLSDFISDATIDSTEIADLSVTHAKLHTDMNLSSKTLTFAANQISGNSVDGGVISNFASTGIDDNASATAVTILSDGKVGIGTTSAAQKLHVYSTSGNTYAKLESNGNNTRSALLPSAKKSDGTPINAFIGVVGDANKMEVATTTNDPIHFYTNNSPTNNGIFLKADGNVGIGNDSPSAPLHIKKSISSTYTGGNTGILNSLFNITNTFSTSTVNAQANIQLGVYDGTHNRVTGIAAVAESATNRKASLVFWTDDENTRSEKLRITGDGNVGIGTDNPDCALDVTRTSGWAEMHLDGASGGDLILKDNGVSYGEIYAGNGHGLVVKSYTGQDLHFLTNAAADSKMTIKSGGNVGIGIAAPVAPLHIEFSNNDGGVGGLLIKNSNTGTTSNFSSLSTQAVNGTIQGTFGAAHYPSWGGSGTFAGSQTSHPFRIVTGNSVRATIDQDGYTTMNNPRMNLGTNYNARTGKTGLRIGRTVYNWFNYGRNDGHTYLHIKTNLENTNSNNQATMSSFHIRGYTYSSESIDSILGFHNWNGTYYSTAYRNNGSRTVVSSSWAPYKSTDNKVVIVLSIGNNYPGISIDYMQNFEYTWRDVEVSAYSKSPNASGVY